MSNNINEYDTRQSPLDQGSTAALAKLVGAGNVGKAQDAMTRKSKGETVPGTIDMSTRRINDMVIDIINAGPGAVERLVRFHNEVKPDKDPDAKVDQEKDSEKERRSSDSKASEDIQTLRHLAGLTEFDSSMSSRAQTIGRDIGATTTGQQFGQAADDIDKGKSTLTGKALEAIKPYISYISFIMTQPELFSKFKTLIMQAKQDMQAQPAESLDLSDVKEGLGYGMPQENDETENVTYSKTKKEGDAQVTISANAKSMDELHDVLKLAGITLPKSDKPSDEEPEHDHDEVDPFDKDGDDVCDGCGREIVDGECGCDDHDHGDSDEEPAKTSMKLAVRPEMSTDKQVLVNYLKDKLAKSLS